MLGQKKKKEKGDNISGRGRDEINLSVLSQTHSYTHNQSYTKKCSMIKLTPNNIDIVS
jgi:hypothetical protein